MNYEDFVFTNEIITGELLELLKKYNSILVKYKNIYPNDETSYYRIKKMHENVEEFNEELVKIVKMSSIIKYTLVYKKEFWLHKDVKYSNYVLLTTVINEKPVLVVIDKNSQLVDKDISTKICEIFRVNIYPDEVNSVLL